jgi:hypothetical protein
VFRVDTASSTLSADHAKEDTFGDRTAQVRPSRIYGPAVQFPAEKSKGVWGEGWDVSGSIRCQRQGMTSVPNRSRMCRGSKPGVILFSSRHRDWGLRRNGSPGVDYHPDSFRSHSFFGCKETNSLGLPFGSVLCEPVQEGPQFVGHDEDPPALPTCGQLPTGDHGADRGFAPADQQ